MGRILRQLHAGLFRAGAQFGVADGLGGAGAAGGRRHRVGAIPAGRGIPFGAANGGRQMARRGYHRHGLSQRVLPHIRDVPRLLSLAGALPGGGGWRAHRQRGAKELPFSGFGCPETRRKTRRRHHLVHPFVGIALRDLPVYYCEVQHRFTEIYDILGAPTVFRITFLALSSLVLAIPAHSAVTIVGSGNIAVTVDLSGSYSVTVPDLVWSFSGSIGSPLNNLHAGTSADGLGGYSEISFDFQAGVVRHASIRSYVEHPDVLFTVSYPSSGAANTFAFPNFTQYPRNFSHLTFSGTFAPPSFWAFASDSPWIFFDSSGKSLILSPAANFMTASTAWGANGELSSGISPEILTIPRGFEHRTLLVVEKGINRAFDTWGHALNTLNGKTRPPNDADTSLNQIGYWTDNGATYYYHMADSMTYPQTLDAVKADFNRAGIPLGYIQLDSWFYPKGSAATWNDNGAGIYQYVAAAPPFMSGLARFQQNLGVPLITHARWIDASSPYHKQYQMSGNVVTDPAYWETIAGYLATSGVATFEQDWLADKAHTDFNLTDGDAVLDNMAASMARRNLTMQYCMASPRHFLQSSKYSNLTTIRTSGDHLQRDRWPDFLYASRFASAMGAWPFTDNSMSTETSQLLLATLSAGPVGIGDPIGSIDGPNLLHAARRDGVIVKPDVPLTPTDASYLKMAHGTDTPQIAFTWSDFGVLRTNYAFAFTQGTNTLAEFSPMELGMTAIVYVYDYFAGTGQLVDPSDVIQRPISGDALYLVLAPVGPSGIAIVGDTDQFITMGKKRVTGFTDRGAARVAVTFADGETARVITGYSPVAPGVMAIDGSIGPVAYDNSTHLFRVPVMAGNSNLSLIRIQASRLGVKPPRRR